MTFPIETTSPDFVRTDTISSVYARIIISLLPLILIYFAILSFPTLFDFTYFANRIGPIWFVAVLSFSAVQLLRIDVRLIWTPLFWLPAQSAIFFGLGPLVLVFGNDITQQTLADHYLSVTADELVWANQLSTVGVVCLLVGIFMHMNLSRRRWQRALSENREKSMLMSPQQVALSFIFFGAILKYLVVLPAAWGVTNIVVPGFLTNVVKLIDVGFAILAYLAARGNSRVRLILLVVLPIHFIMSALTFSKTELIVAALFPAFGDLMGRRDLKRFIFVILGIALIYTWSQDFISYGRAHILKETGTIWKAGFDERLEISVNYMLGVQSSAIVIDHSSQLDYQGWWARLNYAGVQVAARNFYETGVENDSLRDAWLYFIPRFVWPEKPIILGPSWFFYEQLTGNVGTFLGLSIYGDLFWHGGWTAVIIGSILIGWMFSLMSIRSISFLRDFNFIMFPLVLLPLNAAIFAPTNFVANGIIALIPTYLAYIILMSIMRRILILLPRRSST